MESEFRRVWERVRSAGHGNDAAVLEGFIRDEMRDAADYSRLAQMTGALRVRRLLDHLAAEERLHAKKLLAAAYMRYGRDTVMPNLRYDKGERIFSALRRRYARELQSAEAYSKAAGSTAEETLKDVYTVLAAEERKHAAALCGLLETLL